MSTTLTPKQEAFCLTYFDTSNASEAYRKAYSPARATPKTINEKASRLLAQDKVRARIGELQKRVEDLSIWKRQDSIRALVAIAKSQKEPAGSRISAVKELNSMHGYNAPIKNQLLGENGMPTILKARVTFVMPEVRA
jgi:phage terminase small subunit